MTSKSIPNWIIGVLLFATFILAGHLGAANKENRALRKELREARAASTNRPEPVARRNNPDPCPKRGADEPKSLDRYLGPCAEPMTIPDQQGGDPLAAYEPLVESYGPGPAPPKH